MPNIAQFIKSCIISKKGATCSSKAVSDAYAAFNGSSTGRNLLHKELNRSFNKEGQTYQGFMIASKKEEVISCKLSSYEQEMIKYKVEKLKLAEKLAAAKAEQDAKLAATKAEQDAKLAEKLAAAKAEQDAKLAEKLAAAKAEQEALRLRQAEKLAADRLEHELKLKQMDEEREKALRLMDQEFAKEESRKKREFIREENNKPRVITMLSRGFNPYLDLVGYGTSVNQFIEADSLKKVIGYGQFNATNSRNLVIEHKVEEIVDSFSEDKTVFAGESSLEVKGIDSDKVKDIISKIKEDVDSDCIEEVLEQVDEIEKAPLSKTERVKIPVLDKLKSKQDPDTFKEKHKNHYVRAVNKIRSENDKLHINCYTCDKSFEMESSAIHRCHNIPKSKGGDWHRDNVYLCCANCNLQMGNAMSVSEYKISIYTKISEEKNTTKVELEISSNDINCIS